MAYRSSAIHSANVGTNTATPAGVVAGDYLCGVMICDSPTPGVTPPTGWTIQLTVTNPLSSPDGQTMVFADAIATGADNFQWTDTSGGSTVINAAFSGRNTTTPRSALSSNLNTSANVSPFTVSHNGVTAVAGDDVAVFMQIDHVTSNDTWAFSQITNYTERQDGGTVNFVKGAALDTRDNVSAGATGVLSSTATSTPAGDTGGWSVIVVSIAAPSTDHPITIGSGSFSQQGQSVILRPGSTTYLRYRR